MVVVLVVIVLLVGAVWGQQETVALHLAIACSTIYKSVAVHILVSGGLHGERCLSKERRQT